MRLTSSRKSRSRPSASIFWTASAPCHAVSCGKRGTELVRILEAASASLRRGGAPVDLSSLAIGAIGQVASARQPPVWSGLALPDCLKSQPFQPGPLTNHYSGLP